MTPHSLTPTVRLSMIAFISVTLAILSSSGRAEDKPDGYQTKLYDVSELVDQPLESPQSSSGRVTTHMGGMGGGGMGGGMGYGVISASSSGLASDTITNQVLQSLIELHAFPQASGTQARSQTIDANGYETHGAATNGASEHRNTPVCSGLGNQLIVTADGPTQARVLALLDGLRAGRESLPLVRVDVVMVQLAEGSPLDVPGLTAGQLKTMAGQPDAYQISIRCENHHTAHMSSGVERTFTASVTPVVGDQPGMGMTLTDSSRRNIGYHPVIQTVTTGITGDLRVDVGDPQNQTRIQLNLQMISAPEEPTTVKVADGIEVERLELSTAGLKTVVRGEAGHWMVAGVVPITDPQSLFETGIEHSQLVTLVRWQLDGSTH